jgi:pseudouridine-5'-phosphate glycosidase
VHPEVEDALAAGAAVVGLETTLVAHGFPAPEGAAVAAESERRVRAAGAVPATIGVVDGALRVGLRPDEIERFDAAGSGARKLGPRDLAACMALGALGATTVGSTLAVCALAGIRFMGTGGLGGVHRGFPAPPDVSADLGELTRSPVLVVSSGVKSILDVSATAELLETLSVPVLGWRADELPLFYTARGGPPVSARVETAAEASSIARTHWHELAAAGPCAGREPGRRRAAHRRGPRGRRPRSDRGPGPHALRPRLSARAQRRPHAAGEPRARGRQCGARGRGRGGLREDGG